MTGLGRAGRVLGLMVVISASAVLSADDTPRCLPAPPDPRVVVLTDEQAKEMILRNFGPDIANSLGHRLTGPFCVGLDPRGFRGSLYVPLESATPRPGRPSAPSR